MATIEKNPGTAVRPEPTSQRAQDSALARLAGWCHDHRWWVLIIWIIGLVGANVAAQGLGSNFSNNLSGGPSRPSRSSTLTFPGCPAARCR